MRWTTSEYSKILIDRLDVYRKAGVQSRHQIIKDIMHKIQEAAEKDHKPTPDDLGHVSVDYSNLLLTYSFFCMQKIRNWMHNHRAVSKCDSSSDSDDMERMRIKRNMRKNWTFQGVVEQHKKAEIVARTEKLAKAHAGKTEFLSNYRRARTEICNELCLEERTKYEGLVEKWNTEPIPPKVQREYASE